MKFFKVAVLSILLSILSLPFYSPTSYACSCLAPGTPQEELEKMDAVFTGKVLEVDEKYNSTTEVKLSVTETWKGVDTKEVIIYTAMDSAACGVNFEKNKDYLVYAHLEDGEYTTYLCSRTAELPQAQSDLKELGEGTVPTVDKEPFANFSTQNAIIGTLGLALVLGACFFYRWKSTK
ncbi:hypothetical protein HF078_20275 [Bacillus sp. RO2]|uniref:hypothetical protein n=1 Tax=Bacillus sp. RO2 TaxID=2723913 RepID=UPI00145E9690|nr:hypothetical protein [Bacillus sp. RO2]NMH75420.1 hypothetical protein [Bacillus sp. RO2]